MDFHASQRVPHHHSDAGTVPNTATGHQRTHIQHTLFQVAVGNKILTVNNSNLFSVETHALVSMRPYVHRIGDLTSPAFQKHSIHGAFLTNLQL
jgi:hypothetical protein